MSSNKKIFASHENLLKLLQSCLEFLHKFKCQSYDMLPLTRKIADGLSFLIYFKNFAFLPNPSPSQKLLSLHLNHPHKIAPPRINRFLSLYTFLRNVGLKRPFPSSTVEGNFSNSYNFYVNQRRLRWFWFIHLWVIIFSFNSLNYKN